MKNPNCMPEDSKLAKHHSVIPVIKEAKLYNLFKNVGNRREEKAEPSALTVIPPLLSTTSKYDEKKNS